MNRRTLPLRLSLALLVVVLVLTLLFGAWLWNVAPVRALQALGSWLTPLTRTITFLGDEQFSLILVPLVFWCLNKSLGADLAVLLVASGFVNGVLKAVAKYPRPFWSDAKLALGDATGFSLPSGHAQNATTLGGYLAGWIAAGDPRVGQARPSAAAWRTAAVVALVVLILLVALSRVYLGVHFPGDVIWGGAIGLALVTLYGQARPAAVRWLKSRSLSTHILLAVTAGLLPLALNVIGLALPIGNGLSFGQIFFDAREQTLAEAANLSGMALGLWLGLCGEARAVRFVVAGPAWQRILRYVLGVAGLFVVWLGLRLVFPQEPLALGLALRIVRYALTMLWAVLAWPWLFVRLGLGTTRPAEPAAPGRPRAALPA